MSLHSPDKFNEEPPAGFDGLFEWDYLENAFRGNIKPMDLDAVVERRGRFLVFETKRHGAKIPRGQELTLKALIGLDVFTVLIIWGKAIDDEKKIQLWTKHKKHDPILVSNDDIFEIAKAWFDWADSGNYEVPNCLRQKSIGATP